MVTEYLNKAKKDKKVVDFKHIKLLLTGSSAAGKSSFCRLLFGSKNFLLNTVALIFWKTNKLYQWLNEGLKK